MFILAVMWNLHGSFTIIHDFSIHALNSKRLLALFLVQRSLQEIKVAKFGQQDIQ